ncbi:MAG TPA: CHASE domain-containing protein [Candidatus Saccharimonadales bacterium]|nr:CHASE domain-containing protein [Candidatus Saccharimonadales bacterium]
MRRAFRFVRSRPHARWRLVALLLVLIIVVLRFAVWVVVSRENTHSSTVRFTATVQDELATVQRQLELYANTLYGSQAFATINPNASQQDWEDFINSQHIDSRYPGIMSISYGAASSSQATVSRSVAPAQLARTIQGYSLTSDPAVHSAFTNAVSSGVATSVPLPAPFAQPAPSNAPQLLVLLPVYSRGLPTATPTERITALQGFVALALKSKPILDTVFAGPEAFGPLTVHVSDTHGHQYTYGPPLTTRSLTSTTTLIIAGEPWHFTFTAPRNYGLAQTSTILPPLLFFGALPVLFFLVLVVYYATRYAELKSKVTR